MALLITPVSGKGDLDAFIDLPFQIYRDDPHWVPPLRVAVKDVLDTTKNPFFKHAEIQLWLVRDGSEVVGRIAAVIDRNHNQFHEEKTAFFGFFESRDRQDVADLMLAEGVRWAKSRGMHTLRGPMNPSTNHECGLLVEGFKDDPYVMMTYNPGYYLTLLERAGFQKSKDLLAYEVVEENPRFQERIFNHVERLKEKGGVVVRTVEMSRFAQEVDLILEIYNDAWEKNWGFVPMDPEEFRHMAKDMKMIVDPRMLMIAEVKGKPVGFALALPDVNQVFKKIKDGKLLPFGLFKLLGNLKGPFKHKFNRCRIITLGIKRSHQDLGLGAIFYAEYFKKGPSYGYARGEASWILEDNVQMNKAIARMGGEITKRYRILEKSLI